ncbi:hypothetical protein HYH03_000916 [Edaphochlamys debaryana]|uniref:Uncharacterized protein n=1 Tax=Edaphochlamys debaryana TaxID=47281 RepID=A0A835YH44_9CHLO|nr:hypothetical protein HYH03_000916 [Edaphochlamys debaryana]|eukprot:KAG2501098.1 hypothetical protein HYH03_000916 [Edaphochlamys debaryana]
MDMLRNITAGSAAAQNPLLRGLLGPGASEADYAEIAKQAEAAWKMMDDLAEKDPDGYAQFIQEQAQAAKEEVEQRRDPHVEGLEPALVLEAEAVHRAPAQAVAGAGGPVPLVVSGPKAVARVHVWAAKDASGLTPPTTPRGDPLGPSPPASLAGLLLPLAEYKPALTAPAGPVPVHVFHVAAHVSAVRAMAAPTAAPTAVVAALLEGLTQFVEARYGLALSRTVRTLQVHRDMLSEAQLKALWAKQQQQQQGVEAKAGQPLEPGAGTGTGGSLSQGLMEQLKTLGTEPPRHAKPPPPVVAGVGGGGPAAVAGRGSVGEGGVKQAPKKKLIEELD